MTQDFHDDTILVSPETDLTRPGENVFAHRYKHTWQPGKTHTDDRKDRDMLKREATNINASLDWDRHRGHLTITVTAPTGFVWASCKETQLVHTTERSDANWIRESVADLLDCMSQGFIKTHSTSDHDEDCECDTCEKDEEDPQELDFG